MKPPAKRGARSRSAAGSAAPPKAARPARAPRPPRQAASGVPDAAAGADGRERLGRRLQRERPELSFSRAKHEIEAGRVRVEGQVVQDPGAWVEPKRRVEWNPDAPAQKRLHAPTIELLYSDEHVIVAMKPAGLLTQPTPEREKDTLLSRVSLALARQRGGDRGFLAVVHRLDKETSGLVAFAASRRALESLQAQLEDHTMGRLYDAVVEGVVERAAGSFDWALIGDGTHRKRGVAGPDERGKPAVTHFRVEQRYALATRLAVQLETGRTHQIRIHFAYAGHPVVGDRVYRPSRWPSFPIAFPRLALHAAELSFDHPKTGRRVTVRAPLPEDYRHLLERLARPAGRR